MANDKKIEIKISATGGDQAASEIKKVQTAADAASKSTGSSGTDSASNATIQRIEAETRAQEALAAAEREVAAADDSASQSLQNIEKIQRAQVIAGMAQTFGQLGIAMRDMATEAEKADPQMASTLKNWAEGIDKVSTAASLMAQGYAIGKGAGALAAADAFLFGEAIKQMYSMVSAQTAADQAAQNAAEMQGKLQNMLRGYKTPAEEAIKASDDLTASIKSQTEALDEQTEARRRASEVRTAKDEAEGIQRDAQDAEAIRKGAAPEDVKAQRVKDDAEKKVSSLKQGLEDARLKVVGDLERNRREGESIRTERALPESGDPARSKVLAEREAALKEARKKTAAQEADYRARESVVGFQVQSVRGRAANDVQSQQDGKATRLKREQQAEEASQSREKDRQKRERERQEQTNVHDAGAIGKRAERILPKGVSDEFRKSVQAASSRLQDGGDSSELKQLAGLVDQLAKSKNPQVSGISSELASIKQSIATLQKQFKNR